MNLQLIAGLIGAASVAAHYADAITTAKGYFDLGIKEVSMNWYKKLLLHSKVTLIGLDPIPFAVYAILAAHYGGTVLTCVTFSIFNTISAVYGISSAVHNNNLNKAKK